MGNREEVSRLLLARGIEVQALMYVFGGGLLF